MHPEVSEAAVLTLLAHAPFELPYSCICDMMETVGMTPDDSRHDIYQK